MLTCEDCKVNFTNVYLLSKHQNRKVPCGVIFECIRCKKVLATQNSLEKHYSKKNPCSEIQSETTTKLNQTQIETQLEKEKRIDVMLQLQKERDDMIKKSKEIKKMKNIRKPQSPNIINNNINIEICINYIKKTIWISQVSISIKYNNLL